MLTDGQIFHRHLDILFEGTPGQNKVRRREYQVNSTDDMSVVTSLNWNQKIKAGATIAMSVLFCLTAESESVEFNKCPRCNSANSEADSGQMKWFDAPN